MVRKILGLIEPLYIKGAEKEIRVLAKVDTGATKSSISKELVKKLKLGTVKKTAFIKSALGREKRNFVKASVRIKGIRLKVYFSIANRKNMKHNILIGRNILKLGKFLIDPTK